MRQWTVDAFATQPFKGNQACVVEPFAAWPDDVWMQSLAAENNQAETAFLLATADPARFGLRWFTPTMEAPLCGHATLAAAHVLRAEMPLYTEAMTFDTLSGPLSVKRVSTGYEMDFPALISRRVGVPDGLVAALGVEPLEVWASDYLVAILSDEPAVRALRPDIAALKSISGGADRGPGNLVVAALAATGSGYDVVSRFFAPGSGIAEDAATGSAHCILSALFSAKLGRLRLRFHQAYPGRGADIECEHRDARVMLRGGAVTVIESNLRL